VSAPATRTPKSINNGHRKRGKSNDDQDHCDFVPSRKVKSITETLAKRKKLTPMLPTDRDSANVAKAPALIAEWRSRNEYPHR
jgi:hypothetical protein